jgi:arylsulfatase
MACAPEPPRAPDVLLVTVDTLRADHLRSYGYARDTAPRLDALAARGARFANAMVQWPKTWPSMASLITGAYPKTTGVQVESREIPASVTLLGEVFRRGGYDTGAVVANFNVGRTGGFDRGFDHFVESWVAQAGARYVNRPGNVKHYTDGETVTGQALDWLDQRNPDAPFFLWLHYMDPHGPYVPPDRYASLFAPAEPGPEIPHGQIPIYQVQRDEDGNAIRDLAFYRAQYDREIRHFDDALGTLLDGLRDRGLDRNLLVAVTADHGEDMGEHGEYLEHGTLPYQAAAHVPLVVVWPRHVPAGLVVDAPVGLIDLTPTLVDLAASSLPNTSRARAWPHCCVARRARARRPTSSWRAATTSTSPSAWSGRAVGS